MILFFLIYKKNEFFLKIPVISPNKIPVLGKNSHIFICSSYAIAPIFSRIKEIMQDFLPSDNYTLVILHPEKVES